MVWWRSSVFDQGNGQCSMTFWRSGVGGGTPALWKLPKVVFLMPSVLCGTTKVSHNRSHRVCHCNVTITCGASFIYLPFAFQLATGIEWRRSQRGPASGRSISLFIRMRKRGVSQSDTFLISFESCWRYSRVLFAHSCPSALGNT